ncbi:MAG: hypothetical protein AAF657_36720 [Acidobacteriota bacterium]
MKAKAKCCRKYKSKGIACKRCPLLAALAKKDRKCRKKAAKRLKKAA